MALRIKSNWHDSERNESEDKGLEEQAGALAFIAWRLALDKAKLLHGEDYIYGTDGQRIAIICEFLAYEIQIADRLAHLHGLPERDRGVLINALGKRATDHVEDNALDLFGPGDYRSGFIATLNDRMEEYAEFGYTKAGPTYPFLRCLGQKCQSIMQKKGENHMNRWVIDQVMDKEAPEVAEKMEQAMSDLLGW